LITCNTELESVIQQLSAQDKVSFKRLYRHQIRSKTPIQQIDRFEHNAFSVTAPDGKIMLCVYRKLGFVNHSSVLIATVEICQGANTTHTSGQARLVAIPASTEILINYITR
jgi:hypothetical protein